MARFSSYFESGALPFLRVRVHLGLLDSDCMVCMQGDRKALSRRTKETSSNGI